MGAFAREQLRWDTRNKSKINFLLVNCNGPIRHPGDATVARRGGDSGPRHRRAAGPGDPAESGRIGPPGTFQSILVYHKDTSVPDYTIELGML